MKHMIALVLPLILLASAASHAQGINLGNGNSSSGSAKLPQTIIRAGSQPSAKGPAQYFTGDVRIDPLFPAREAASYSGGLVTFEAGARSAWHTHPAGQYLIVTSGTGRTQEWGGPVVEIHPGDVVWCPPGVKHWHGAMPGTAMTHLAFTGTTADGKNVTWMEKVTDEQYNAH
jgi:quercetin dioxygenase-like cupin family protein